MNEHNYDLSAALMSLRPRADWILRGDKYSGLEWFDKNQTKPTREEVFQKQEELKYQEEVKEYQRQRAAEYPPYADQLDKIFHDGIDAWKLSIQAVKDKYPKQTMDADELQARKDLALFNAQIETYKEAKERLSRYILSVGVEEVTEDVVIGQEEVFNEETEEREYKDIIRTVITQEAIDPLPELLEVSVMDPITEERTKTTIKNPKVVKDEEEREAAQAVIDSTPQAVIDAVDK